MDTQNCNMCGREKPYPPTGIKCACSGQKRITELEAEREQLKARLDEIAYSKSQMRRIAIQTNICPICTQHPQATAERDRYKAELEKLKASLEGVTQLVRAAPRTPPPDDYCSACDGPCREAE